MLIFVPTSAVCRHWVLEQPSTLDDKMLKLVIVTALLLTNTQSKEIPGPTKIELYETELAEARMLINDLGREKSDLEIKNYRLQEQMQDMQRQLDDAKKYRQIDRQTIDKVNQQISDGESEINILRRTIESLETDRVRDLDRINKLQTEVDKLKIIHSNSGTTVDTGRQNTAISPNCSMTAGELEDAKKYRQIDRQAIDTVNQQISDAEAEINLLRKSVASLETDRARDRERINQLQAEVDKLRIDLNNETLNRIDAENKRQTLEEEVVFLKKVNAAELKQMERTTGQ